MALQVTNWSQILETDSCFAVFLTVAFTPSEEMVTMLFEQCVVDTFVGTSGKWDFGVRLMCWSEFEDLGFQLFLMTTFI